VETITLTTDRLLDEREAAQVLGCSTALLRKWRVIGEDPSYCKVGRLVRYRNGDLLGFLEAHRVTTKAA
jgi:predicted DNA-binding transcriptional regulator AlpA